MNLDNYIEGDFDPNNPANQEPSEIERLTLPEAMDSIYGTDFEAYASIENALEEATKELDFMIQLCSQTQQIFLEKRLTKIKQILDYGTIN